MDNAQQDLASHFRGPEASEAFSGPFSDVVSM